jgi:2-haloacid dehalogenase
MPYRSLLLDADGTLLDLDRAEAEAIRNTLRHFQLPDTEEWIEAYHRINDAMWKQLERGEIAKKDLRWMRFSHLLDHFGICGNSYDMAEAYVDELSSHAYLLPGALEACRELAKHCRLYIITNGIAAVQHRRMDSVPISAWIEKCFISEEVGYEKPDVRFFDIVAQNIPDYDPAAALVVGDSLTSDMAGGIRAGLDTCWINPSKDPIPSNLPITFSIPSITDLPDLLMRNEANQL